MRVERATIRLHVKPEEKEGYPDYKKAFFSLLGKEHDEDIMNVKRLDDNKISFHESTATGFEERKIIVMEGLIKNPKAALSLLKRIVDAINDEDKRILFLTADTRIDDDDRLYIRLDKESLKKDTYMLVEHGECYRLSFQIVTYPKNKDVAIKEFLSFMAK